MAEISTNTRMIKSNSNNFDFNLQQFPKEADKEVLKGIDMKMFDFMKKTHPECDDMNAIDYMSKKITYNEVFEEINKYAKALSAYGINKGDVVSIMLPNMPELIYLKYALNRIGAVANLIDPRNNPNTVLNYVNNSNSKILITILDKYQSTITPIINKLMVEKIYSISPLQSINFCKKTSSIKQTMGHYLYEYKKIILELQERIKANNRYDDISELLKYEKQHTGKLDSEFVPNSPTCILYTSGTTGTMKGAVLSNEAYNSIYKNLQFGITDQYPGEKFCGIIPYFTSYGSGAGMFNSMCSRFEQYLYPNFKPSNLVQIVECDQPNALIAVPDYYKMLINSGKKIDSLHHIVIGGDKILPETMKKFREAFKEKKIIVGYGETEFLGVLSVTMKNDCRIDSSGVPLPGVKVKIVDPNTMNEVDCMTEGEAFVSSKSMMLGYINNQEETNKITAYDEENNKYYGTGDKMYITPDGELCFVDRYKRLMKRPDGHQVNANPIEQVITSIKGVEDCCVVGLRYKDLNGVIPTAFVKLDKNIISLNRFIQMAEKESKEKIASYREKALAYVLVEDMPLTNMGKIDALKLSSQKLEDISDAIIVDYTFIENNPKMKKKLI